MPSEDGNEPGGFWRSIPGIVSAVAALITAVTGLIIGLSQIGGSGKHEPPSQGRAGGTTTAAAPTTADDVAGTWSGRVRRGKDQVFELQLDIAKGCGLTERCGSISVSDPHCFGDLSLKQVVGDRYEFSVDHFSAASSSRCTPGAGEYLVRHGEDALLYTTGYDSTIRGILRPPR